MFIYDAEKVNFAKKALNAWADAHKGDLPLDSEINECLYTYKLISREKIDFRSKTKLLEITNAILKEWRQNSFTCCICGKKRFGFGNNPYPLCDVNDYTSRCCDECDYEHVIPARIAMYYRKKGDQENGKK